MQNLQKQNEKLLRNRIFPDIIRHMTSTVSTGAGRPQSHTNTGYARDYSVRRTAPAQPNRSAEDPFAAANGTLRFANERKAAAAAATRTASTGTRSTTSRSTSSGTQRRSTSSGTKQPQKRRRKKKNNRLFLFALITLLLAVILLVTIIAVSACGGCSQKNPSDPLSDPDSSPSLDGNETSGPDETPAPVTDETVITKSAMIEGVSVQNLTVGEARERIKAALEEKRDSVDITVAYESYEPLLLTADTIGLYYTDADINDALSRVVSGMEVSSSIPPTFSGELLRSALYDLSDKIPNHAVNATAEVKYKSTKIDGVTYYQPYWDFKGGENGAQIDFTELENQITHALETGDFTASLTPSVTVSEPEITVDVLKGQLTKLASYQTNYSFKGSSKDPEYDENCRGRDANISKAVGMMQVTELKAGQRFSFNKVTGDRSEKNGWAYANAVYQGQGYRKETGGGVCQVSTTMFNALLRAGITDFTRSGHSIPSDYVTSNFEQGLGFDATVDSNHIDFGFKNTTGHTIYMFVYITKNNSRRKNINVEIYGQKEEGVEYKVRNEILEHTPSNDESKYEYEYDKTMLTTDKKVLLRNPHDGYRVKTYVDKYQDGNFVKTVRTEETVYKVIYPKYRVGTATITPKPTNTPKPTATPKPEDPSADGEP